MNRVDVLVIGAGLVGSATAWHLARGSASTLLIDAGDPNTGASGQNAGSLHFQIERRFLENGEKLAAEAAHITSISRMAIEEWRRLEAELGEDLYVRQDGGLMVAETGAEVTLLENKVRREQDAGLRTLLLDGAEARARAPSLSMGIVAAAYLADEGHADPKTVTPAFVRAAKAAGATFWPRTRIVAIARRSGGFVATLDTEGEVSTLHAGSIMLAAGAWSPRVAALANLHLPLFPVALSMNVTERLPAFLPQLIQHVGRRLSMKQAHSGNVLIGGGWPARLRLDDAGHFDPGLRPDLIEASLSGNLEAAVSVVPRIAGANLIRSWTGVTAITSDQLPLVGEVPRLPGFYVAAGGSVFTLGPTFARLIARRILGLTRPGADDPLEIVSPARFEHLNGFMG